MENNVGSGVTPGYRHWFRGFLREVRTQKVFCLRTYKAFHDLYLTLGLQAAFIGSGSNTVRAVAFDNSGAKEIFRLNTATIYNPTLTPTTTIYLVTAGRGYSTGQHQPLSPVNILNMSPWWAGKRKLDSRHMHVVGSPSLWLHPVRLLVRIFILVLILGCLTDIFETNVCRDSRHNPTFCKKFFNRSRKKIFLNGVEGNLPKRFEHGFRGEGKSRNKKSAIW